MVIEDEDEENEQIIQKNERNYDQESEFLIVKDAKNDEASSEN